MDTIPIRLPPLPGEALDSWLETYAHLLHACVQDIFTLAGLSWDRAALGNGLKPWVLGLDEAALTTLSTVTGVPAATLAAMTLARYDGTGLVNRPGTGSRPKPRWWPLRLSGSRYCPACLTANGGRWMLAWRLPWAFACTTHHVLLADTCPSCGQHHRHTRGGEPRETGRCDTTGLPLPPLRPGRGGSQRCTSDLTRAPVLALSPDGHVLAAQRHIDTIIAALADARGQPGELTRLWERLDDIHIVARESIRLARGSVPLPAVASAVRTELGAKASPPAPSRSSRT